MLGLVISALMATQAVESAPPLSVAEEIVVQGQRLGTTANAYVENLLPAPFNVQFGAFEDDLCAKVVGMPPNLGKEVTDRIGKVAATAGIGVAPAGCFANLMIIVVDDKRALIDGLVKSDPAYLFGIRPSARKALRDASLPFASWQVKELVGSDGMPLRVDQDGISRLYTPIPPSRYRNNVRPRVLGSVVVIEKRALVNVSTIQIADFALLRALMPSAATEQPSPGNSVLSLFNQGVSPVDGPQSLTAWDLAFLKSLKAMPLDRFGSAQRKVIRDQMVREMARSRTD